MCARKLAHARMVRMSASLRKPSGVFFKVSCKTYAEWSQMRVLPHSLGHLMRSKPIPTTAASHRGLEGLGLCRSLHRLHGVHARRGCAARARGGSIGVSIRQGVAGA
eukprot:363803-Chlamydomonas_euryale.AAC.7